MFQPPSGGCVLKRNAPLLFLAVSAPAAFGRLCVETINPVISSARKTPAAFGRLCVETFGLVVALFVLLQPPSGGCVLKLSVGFAGSTGVCQPPSGGCVLKQSK